MTKPSKEIADLRREYTASQLDVNSVLTDPIMQFRKWFDEAGNSDILEPNAMVLSTIDQNSRATQRTVLLKAIDKDGFVFYTNYTSRKAKHIENNPNVSVLFPWYELERQVSIEGKVEKVSTAQSLKYFLSRPFGSQLGAWVSNQSEVISSRSILEEKLAQMKSKFNKGKVPLPDFWGGYKIIPERIEFWQGRSNRLHDRIEFKKELENWKIQRLSP
ncbi:MAG: pyridoxamine 5'-phosphate oxidase [Cytophagales bacterium]